jgi:TonB-linked SusC/RagA family outer membrane protein
MAVSGWRSGGAALFAVVLCARLGGAQEARGTITGRVIDEESRQPVPAAQVRVVGTTLGVQSSPEGRYAIPNVPAGPVTVRVIRVGYGEQSRQVTVAAGAPTPVDFVMRRVAVQLSAVVTTATGQERRVEVGNAIAQVDAAELVRDRQIGSVSDLLTARTAGVQVLPPSTTGASARIRIRGTNSLSLSNDPIYVIDGVRVRSDAASSTIDVGGTAPGRASDINPDEIEKIEVVRGPSAATLYGTDAANGVIVITTTRGRAGRPQWNLYAEGGAVTDRNDYPTAYTAFGRTSAGAPTSTCFLGTRAAGGCTVDSVTSYNLFDDPRATPIATAPRQQYGAQVSGGSEAVRFFLSGEWEDEQGRYRLPTAFADRLEEQGTGIRAEWRRPNAYNRISGRANLNATLSPRLEAAVSTAYVRSSFRQPPSDNNTIGLLSNAFGGPGVATRVDAAGDTLYGYRLYTPDRMFQNVTEQNVDRFIGSLTTSWRPLDWLTTRGNFGLDFTGRQDASLCRFDECVRAFEQDLGFKTDNRGSIYQYTADVAATASYGRGPDLSFKSTAGAQFFNNVLTVAGGTGAQLAPGGTTVTQGAVLTAFENNVASRTLGAFVQQDVALYDRVFLTAAVRADDNSAFGADFKAVYYPKASVSWVLSQEPFFRKPGWLDQLRLRAAVGASGNQPGTTDAVRFFLGRTLIQDQAETPAITFGSLGNSALKPERTQELETGIDVTAFANRLSLELTYYNKNSRDALVQRVLAPSTGTDSTVAFANLGQVRNRGLEGLVIARLLDRPRLGWEVTLNGSTNSNRIVDLGELPAIVGTTVDQREGYPLNAYFQLPYTYSDADGDGLLSRDEVQVSDTRTYLGYSIPRHEVSITNGFDFFNRRVRVSALVDHKGGHKLYNNTERIRCASRRNCRGLIDPTASLAEQARVIALTETPTQSLAGFIEDASFWRLREVAVTLTAPERWLGRLGRARSASLTLAGRNLGKWTDYSGTDPESNYNLLTDVPADFQTIAPPTYFTARLNLGF